MRELRRGGASPLFERVETPEDFSAAVEKASWDVIICDHNVPRFSSFAALELAQEHKLDVPFIVVSDAIGEDLAVQTMRAGAHDYLMKGSLRRLLPAVEREIRDARIRREQKTAKQALQSSEARYRLLFDLAMQGVVIFLSGRVVECNDRACGIFGLSRDEFVGKGTGDIFRPAASPEQDSGTTGGILASASPSGGPFLHATGKAKDGDIPLEVRSQAFELAGQTTVLCLIRDISEPIEMELQREVLEKHLQEAEHMNTIGTLAAVVAHDFNNLLVPIIGYTKWCIRIWNQTPECRTHWAMCSRLVRGPRTWFSRSWHSAVTSSQTADPSSSKKWSKRCSLS